MSLAKTMKKNFNREAIYNDLTVKFFPITSALLKEQEKTELDGLLWDLALRLVEVE